MSTRIKKKTNDKNGISLDHRKKVPKTFGFYKKSHINVCWDSTLFVYEIPGYSRILGQKTILGIYETLVLGPTPKGFREALLP